MKEMECIDKLWELYTRKSFVLNRLLTEGYVTYDKIKELELVYEECNGKDCA